MIALFHGGVSDQDRPYVGAGLGDHEHADGGDGIGPKNHGNVESEAQHDGQPHEPELPVVMLLGAAVEQDDDQKSQQREGNVAVDTPGQGSVCAEPPVLREQAKQDPGG